MAETPEISAPVVEAVVPDKTTFNYREHLPEDVKSEKLWDAVPDFQTLAKNYVATHHYNVGALKMPPKEAPAEDWHRFYQKLGKPESAEGYQYTIPEVSADIEVDAAGVKPFLKVAHDLHLLPSQVQGVINWVYGDVMNQSAEVQRAQAAESANELQKAWPGQLYQKNVSLAQRLIETVGGEEVQTFLEKSGAGNNPGFIKMMARLAQRMVEDRMISGDVDGIPTKESARAEINKYTKDRTSAYWNTKDPDHKAVFAKVKGLYELLASEGV
jgi:hypothetical protein